MALCPGCNKFASMETEVDDVSLEFDPASGMITGSVHLIRRSECCSQDMKETTFDVEHDTGLGEVSEEAEADFDDGEVTEGGGGRYKKNMIGFVVNASVKHGDKELWSGSVADELAASHWDELN